VSLDLPTEADQDPVAFLARHPVPWRPAFTRYLRPNSDTHEPPYFFVGTSSSSSRVHARTTMMEPAERVARQEGHGIRPRAPGEQRIERLIRQPARVNTGASHASDTFLLADADDASPVTEGHTTVARDATYLAPHRKLAASSTLPCPR